MEKGKAILLRKEKDLGRRRFEYEIKWKELERREDIDGSSAVEVLLDEGRGDVELEQTPLLDDVLIFPAMKFAVIPEVEIWVALLRERYLLFLSHHKNSSVWKVPFRSLSKLHRS